MAVNQGLPGQKNFHLASSFGKWIEGWRHQPRFGDKDVYDDYEQCGCPWNMQTSRFLRWRKVSFVSSFVWPFAASLACIG